MAIERSGKAIDQEYDWEPDYTDETSTENEPSHIQGRYPYIEHSINPTGDDDDRGEFVDDFSDDFGYGDSALFTEPEFPDFEPDQFQDEVSQYRNRNDTTVLSAEARALNEYRKMKRAMRRKRIKAG